MYTPLTKNIEDNPLVNMKTKCGAFFDVSEKKNLLESLIMYLFIVFLFSLLSFVIPDSDKISDDLFYILTSLFGFLAILVISQVKGLNRFSWVLALMGGAIIYIFGFYYGLLVVLYPLMKQKPPLYYLSDPLKKTVVLQTLKKGIIMYIGGALLTLGSEIISPLTNNYHFVFYGLICYGLVEILRVVYYSTWPVALEKKVQRMEQKQKQKIIEIP